MLKNKKLPPILRIIFGYISLHKLAFICALICVLFTAFGNIAAPIVLQNVTNLITKTIEHINETGDFSDKFHFWNEIVTNGCLLIGAYVISVTAGLTYSQINAVAGQKYMDDLRRALFDHMQDLPVKYFDRNDKGDIMSVYLNDVDTIRQLIINSISEVEFFVCTFVSVMVMMIMFSVWLCLITIVAGVIMVFATRHIGGHSSRNFLVQQKNIGRQEGYVEEMMNGLKVIKSFCHEKEAIAGYMEITEIFRKTGTKANSYANILMPVLGNIGNMLYVVVAVVGTLFFIYDIPNFSGMSGLSPFSIAVIVSFLPIVRQFTNSATQMANQVNTIALANAGSKRITDLLDEEAEKDEGYVTLVRGRYDLNGNIVECSEKEATLWAWKHPHTADGSVTYTLLQGDMRMFDVDFGYNPDKIVLHNITLYAKPGQKVAFVGATGAGKTTITNLLNRFYDIADGKIRYDGININKIKKKDLRRSLGMVLQDTNLFSGTIMDNIRYGKLDATDEECIAAAKLANADSFITRLPQGYNTYLTNDGGNLSQGQRQLLSIARAAVANAPVMILDEATSSIDTRTEAIVTAGMDNLMKGRTVFVIAHRLSTIQNSDVIMVLDHGRIIERGSHDDLIKLKGVYYQLYTGAFELE